jgi:hypothetical protein
VEMPRIDDDKFAFYQLEFSHIAPPDICCRVCGRTRPRATC